MMNNAPDCTILGTTNSGKITKNPDETPEASAGSYASINLDASKYASKKEKGLAEKKKK